MVSCEKDPDMDKLDNEYLVFTSHDTSTKFNDFSTYYIPDSILIIGDKKDPEYWKDENAQTIINAFKTKMNAAGYTAVDKDDADLGLQVSYVASTYYSMATTMTVLGGAITPVIGIPDTGAAIGEVDGTIPILSLTAIALVHCWPT